MVKNNQKKFCDRYNETCLFDAEIEFEPENYFKKSIEIQTQPKEL